MAEVLNGQEKEVNVKAVQQNAVQIQLQNMTRSNQWLYEEVKCT